MFGFRTPQRDMMTDLIFKDNPRTSGYPLHLVFGEVDTTEPTGTQVYVRQGAAWFLASTKLRDNEIWETTTVRVFNGGLWV